MYKKMYNKLIAAVGRAMVYHSETKRAISLKLAPLCILCVLREYSDTENSLSESFIRQKVDEEFGLSLDRRTVSNNLSMLLELSGSEYELHRDCKKRSDGQGGQQDVSTGWFIEPTFERSEAHYLLDALVCENKMPQKQKRGLFEKIRKLSGPLGLANYGEVYSPSSQGLVNKQLFYTIDVLSSALDAGASVSFWLGTRSLLGKLEKGEGSRCYKVIPEFIAASYGRYYLVAHFPEETKRYHFRIDLMLDIAIEKEDSKDASSKNRGSKNEIQKYVEEHLFMYGGALIEAEIQVPDTSLARNLIFDSYGERARIATNTKKEGYLDVRVRANSVAIRMWALQNSELVEVLSPQTLRDDILKVSQQLVEKYGENAQQKPF